MGNANNNHVPAVPNRHITPSGVISWQRTWFSESLNNFIYSFLIQAHSFKSSQFDKIFAFTSYNYLFSNSYPSLLSSRFLIITINENASFTNQVLLEALLRNVAEHFSVCRFHSMSIAIIVRLSIYHHEIMTTLFAFNWNAHPRPASPKIGQLRAISAIHPLFHFSQSHTTSFLSTFLLNLPSIEISHQDVSRSWPASTSTKCLPLPLCCYRSISTSFPFGRLAEADSPKTTSMVLLPVNRFTQGQCTYWSSGFVLWPNLCPSNYISFLLRFPFLKANGVIEWFLGLNKQCHSRHLSKEGIVFWAELIIVVKPTPHNATSVPHTCPCTANCGY